MNTTDDKLHDFYSVINIATLYQPFSPEDSVLSKFVSGSICLSWNTWLGTGICQFVCLVSVFFLVYTWFSLLGTSPFYVLCPCKYVIHSMPCLTLISETECLSIMLEACVHVCTSNSS
jgi:hypothetical protein